MHRDASFNYDWRYAPEFRPGFADPGFDDGAWETVRLPHSNVDLPFNNFDQEIYQFESCYRKTFEVRSLGDDEVLYVRFEGVMAYARVFLNGRFMGEHKGGYTAFRIDLTPALRRAGENLLAVHVDSRERDDTPPFGYVIDYLTYGGIYREVTLEHRHRTNLESVLIKPRGVVDGTPAVDLDLRFRHEGPAVRVKTHVELEFEGEAVRTWVKDIDLDREPAQLRRLSFEAGDVRPWDIDRPNLYTLRMRLELDGRAVGTYAYRFGFREVEVRTDGFFLNGERVKLRGLNRHQSFPYVGYAMPKHAQYGDAEILKEKLGVNAVRSSHYPPSRHFLDRCDELGLLVFEEIPGWQHIGDADWKDTLLRNLEEMILTDGNHPSVFIWGVRVNESADDDELYTRTNAVARSLDPTRPTGGVRCFERGSLLEDVYTFNDFSHTGGNGGLRRPRRIVGKKAPYMVTEHNGHAFPTKKYDNEGHRLSQAKRHLKVLDAMYADEAVSGAFGWVMADYNTHRDFGSGDMVCYHGVLDMYRIPKTAAAAYASQSDTTPVLKLSSSMNIGENEGALLGDVYVFTNLDSVKMYKSGELVREFFPGRNRYPNVPHPPVVVDDFLGDAIEKNEDFSRADARLVKRLLLKVSREGANLGLLDSIRAGWLFLKNRMNYQDAEDLYTKYFGGWGGATESYTFEGWADGRCVERIVIDRDSSTTLNVEVDTDELVEAETWDTTRCVVRLTDRNGNDAAYAHDAFTIDTEGPVELIGPRVVALVGGSVGFWVKTTGGDGAARIHVISERFGTVTREVTVRKETKA